MNITSTTAAELGRYSEFKRWNFNNVSHWYRINEANIVKMFDWKYWTVKLPELWARATHSHVVALLLVHKYAVIPL